MKRRSFIYQAGLAVLDMASNTLLPVAGPFKPSDFSKHNLIPAHKKFSKAWGTCRNTGRFNDMG